MKRKAVKYQPTFDNTLHWLIAGTTGSGKSTLTHRVIKKSVEQFSPDVLRIIWIDFKATAAINYDDLPHLALPQAYEPGEALEAVQFAYSVVNERKNSVRKKCADESKWYWLVVVIDEITELVTDCPKVVPMLNSIARLGREFKVVFLCATQYPTASTIDSQFLQQMTTRICFKVKNAQASRVILDEPGAESLPPYEAMCQFNKTNKTIRKKFQYLNPKTDIPNLVKWANKKYGKRDYLKIHPEKESIIETLDGTMKTYLDAILKYETPGLKVGMNRINEIIKNEYGVGIGNKKQTLLQQAVLES